MHILDVFLLVLSLLKYQFTEIFMRSFANFSANKISVRHCNSGFMFVFAFHDQGLSMRRGLQIRKLRLRDPALG